MNETPRRELTIGGMSISILWERNSTGEGAEQYERRTCPRESPFLKPTKIYAVNSPKLGQDSRKRD